MITENFSYSKKLEFGTGNWELKNTTFLIVITSEVRAWQSLFQRFFVAGSPETYPALVGL